MVVNFEYLKINMIINLVRDYFTLKQIANVGVLYIAEKEELHIVCTYGMAGQDYKMYIGDLLEEEDAHVMLRMLVNQLKTVG
ncbi:hypothetical protein [Neobacillus sp. FSL H8-0543]|uniref:hypothetical protein n=1 Tax=Neobacillus sp. FSL H8-0543 TaxID=2954672 RepID=UPI0031597081